MPAAFPAAVDKIHAVTHEAKETSTTLLNKGRIAIAALRATEPDIAIEDILRGVEAVKRAIELKPEIQYSFEYESLRDDISWWLAEHPQVCIKFAKDK
jgi:hypothetical protein